jgi:2-oxo-4-hydroxy-4-carboxy--5-ureidoimidazoline (OHCU) decarboxylase
VRTNSAVAPINDILSLFVLNEFLDHFSAVYVESDWIVETANRIAQPAPQPKRHSPDGFN